MTEEAEETIHGDESRDELAFLAQIVAGEITNRLREVVSSLVAELEKYELFQEIVATEKTHEGLFSVGYSPRKVKWTLKKKFEFRHHSDRRCTERCNASYKAVGCYCSCHEK